MNSTDSPEQQEQDHKDNNEVATMTNQFMLKNVLFI